MKYYIIAGEASGDLHAANLMKSLLKEDPQAAFRFFGGDEMTAAAGDKGCRVRHYKELAYMGFVPVLLHLPTIMRNMRLCKRDIVEWNPDAVILVDYAGFNLSIAKFLAKRRNDDNDNARPRIFYYIAPKLWAWKEYRIKYIQRDVDELFSILPFEKAFFEGKHHYPIHYVGNPTAHEVRTFRREYKESKNTFCKRNGLSTDKPIIALLAGSRRQEINDNLPTMIESVEQDDALRDYQFVIAGAPGIEKELYKSFTLEHKVRVVYGLTYQLLSHATAALVTSGTATLETSLFDVPQVVCYRTPVPPLTRWGFKHILNVDYISLVNLIATREVVSELFADRFGVEQIRQCLNAILPGQPGREEMLRGYADVARRLGEECAPDNAARLMVCFTENYARRP